jgi:hypothetical protein
VREGGLRNSARGVSLTSMFYFFTTDLKLTPFQYLPPTLKREGVSEKGKQPPLCGTHRMFHRTPRHKANDARSRLIHFPNFCFFFPDLPSKLEHQYLPVWIKNKK